MHTGHPASRGRMFFLPQPETYGGGRTAGPSGAVIFPDPVNSTKRKPPGAGKPKPRLLSYMCTGQVRSGTEPMCKENIPLTPFAGTHGLTQGGSALL